MRGIYTLFSTGCPSLEVQVKFSSLKNQSLSINMRAAEVKVRDGRIRGQDLGSGDRHATLYSAEDTSQSERMCLASDLPPLNPDLAATQVMEPFTVSPYEACGAAK